MAWIVSLVLGASLIVAAGVPQAKSKQAPKAKQTQPADQKQDQAQPTDQQQQKPAPLFTGKVKLTSSRQGKGTASAGFNGVGPDGKVKEALLAASPSADAKAKAARLSLVEADLADVQAFAKEGNLNPPPSKSGEKKGK